MIYYKVDYADGQTILVTTEKVFRLPQDFGKDCVALKSLSKIEYLLLTKIKNYVIVNM